MKIKAELTWSPPSTAEIASGFTELAAALDSSDKISVDTSKGAIANASLSEPLHSTVLSVNIPMPKRKWNPFNYKRHDSDLFTVACIPLLPEDSTQ